MSQHSYHTRYAQRAVIVTLGYDRALNLVFMTVLSDEDDEPVYSNLDDPDAGTRCQDVNYYRRVLKRLGLCVPEAMFAETTRDQHIRMGNRFVRHFEDGSQDEA